MRKAAFLLLALWCAWSQVQVWTGELYWKNILTLPEKIALPLLVILAYASVWQIAGYAGHLAGQVLGRSSGRAARVCGLAAPVALASGLEIYQALRLYALPAVPFMSAVKIGALCGSFAAGAAGGLLLGLLLTRKARPDPGAPAHFGRAGAAAVAAFCALFTLVFFVYGWSLHLFQPQRASPPPTDVPNLVLVTIDTLSAPYTGLHGYPVRNTPGLEHIASQGAMFGNTIVQIPITGPSHASLLSGLYPRVLGRFSNFDPPIHSDVTTLPQLFRARGYQTASFVNVPMCGAMYGLERGFATTFFQNMSQAPVQMLADRTSLFYLGFNLWEFVQKKRFGYDMRDENYPLVRHWVRNKLEPPFFLWFHTYIPHVPYTPPGYALEALALRVERGLQMDEFKAINSKDIAPPGLERAREIRDAYVAEIYHADRIVTQLYDELETAGVLANTVLIITSDHGEEILLRDGFIGHDRYINNPISHVPLIIRYPGAIPPGTRVPQVVSLLDIFPTVQELFGLEFDGQPQGESLLPLIAAGGNGEPGQAFTEVLAEEGDTHKLSITRGGLQYIFHLTGPPHRELFDRTADPLEIRNLAGDPAMSDTLGNLETGLMQWHNSLPPVMPASDAGRDAATIQKLKDLGYVK